MVDFRDLKRIPVSEIAHWLGMRLKREPSTERCACPFCHSENKRSFVVVHRHNYWRCLACERTGDGLQLVVLTLGITHRQAAKRLVHVFGPR
jgi:hypothetical protein